MSLIQATLIEISDSADKKKTFGKVSLRQSGSTTTPVLYHFVIDMTLGTWMAPITVLKDDVAIWTSAYYSPRNFRSVGRIPKTTYWMIWEIIRMAQNKRGIWTVPFTMSFNLRREDTAEHIMLPNARVVRSP